MQPCDFDKFLASYLYCAIWASCDEDGGNLSDSYSTDDFSQAAREQAIAECSEFCDQHYGMLREAVKQPGYGWSSAGADFWFTRCGHGVGFWDRGLPGDLGCKLSEASRLSGDRDVYTGDDGMLYFG